jgi:putative ABC transport system permease protein
MSQHKSKQSMSGWLGHYFKTAYRTMQKNKLHSFLNITGMSVAFTCSILLLLSVYHDFSFDQFHANKDRLFKVYDFYNKPDGPELSNTMGYPMGPTLKAENIGVEKSTRIKYGGNKVRYNAKEINISTIFVDNDFFSMFSFPVVKGNQASPLGNLSDIVISEDAASKIFSRDEDPIGKKIEVNAGGGWKNLIVSAVVKTKPQNSSINYELMARIEINNDYAAQKDQWFVQHHSVYVQIAANTTQANVEQRLRTFSKKYTPGAGETELKKRGYKPDSRGDMEALRLLPLSEIHFNSHIGTGNTTSKSFLYILILTSVVILVIACFNFINLNIGIAFTRSKEIGIRKCLGAGKGQVWLQIWGESFLTAFIALLIGITATLFLVKGFNKLFVTKIDSSLLYQPQMILLLAGILVVVSFFAGSYPAFVMTKLRTVEILKGKISMKSNGLFRNTLVAVQFMIATVLICTTIVIYQQFQHLRKAPLGYNTNAIVSVPIADEANGKNIVQQMRMRLSSQTSIESVTGSSINLGMGKDNSISKWSSSFGYKGKEVSTTWLTADVDFLKTMGIKPKEGRDLSSSYVSDTANAVIVTESMAKQLANGSVAGLSFFSDSSKPRWNVVGVIPDFQFYSMHEAKEPMTIRVTTGSGMSYVLIRVSTSNPASAMELIKNTYAQVEPGKEFKGSFVNENVDRWYENEKRLSKMFSITASVAIVLCCMGLFGITLIVIAQRVKEIGVRKVLGASVTGIAVLVSKSFIRPVIVAIVVASPIAWWIMQKWLQDFSYRITISWWMFALTGLLALSIAIITISYQAIKAALANPVKSLRTE